MGLAIRLSAVDFSSGALNKIPVWSEMTVFEGGNRR